MLIYKLVFTVSGDSLRPECVICKIKGKLTFDKFYSPDNLIKRFGREEKYGYGSMFFMHPLIFGIQGGGIEY